MLAMNTWNLTTTHKFELQTKQNYCLCLKIAVKPVETDAFRLQEYFLEPVQNLMQTFETKVFTEGSLWSNWKALKIIEQLLKEGWELWQM